ncbi:TPA: PD-(D/E)XK nuclease family protein [Klebsiella variicola]|uniref:PD-(D/E)XK nuclease family protein n=1 Tax=Klebsiella variicola TaxID=244366 RepID=UPI00292A7260|nr:PD-(D/E)XK nuclease family protein [Klebsiella variicola]MDV1444083.1 PD-(D/E)XK nuclease family protein [Klebsiella variicola subsp. variicola]
MVSGDYLHYCRDQVDTNPTGDNTNRFFVEFNADNFVLLIEVKFDTYEQPEQFARYCYDAKLRATSRHWAVIFLTPHGRKPLTCGLGFKSEYVPCISWRHLALRHLLVLP